MRKRHNHKSGTGATQRAAGDRQFVGALHRGLEILRCFRADDGPLGNQELAQRSGLPKATVSRLTYTLSKLGYLDYLNDEGKYRMGVPVLGLGYACLGGMKILDTVRPHMQELANYAGDGALVALGGRDDLSIIYLACARSVGVISLQLNVGSRISLARSSIGCAYLAAMKQDEREVLMERLRQHYGDDRWPPVRQGIQRSIEEIRTQGYCLNIGDWHPHISAVATPGRLRTGRLVVAVSAETMQALLDATARFVREHLELHWRIPNCSVTELHYGRTGWSLIGFNLFSHLRVAGEAMVTFR